LRVTLITLYFVLADDLHINILKFVAGHGTVVPPVSSIVFGCKQERQYSRTHQVGFIRAVSWSAQNAESHWSHVHITLTQGCSAKTRGVGTASKGRLQQIVRIK